MKSKPYPHADGYLIRDDGIVFTQWRKEYRNQPRSQWLRVNDWETVEPTAHNHGYLEVRIMGGKRLLHVVVLETFVGPCPNGQQCRHLNGIKTDCRLSNLTWGELNTKMKWISVFMGLLK